MNTKLEAVEQYTIKQPGERQASKVLEHWIWRNESTYTMGFILFLEPFF